MNKLSILSAKFLLPIILTSLIVSIWSIFSQSIRLDEAQSISMATKPIETIIKLTATDVHVPLYNILLHFWLQIFDSSIIAARSLSFLFFLLTLPLLYLFTKEASSRKIALLSVTIFTLSPFIMWYSGEARMYTLFTLVTTANHLFFLRMIKSNATRGKLGYFLTLIFGLYTHYFFIFLIATQLIYTFAVLWFRKKKKIMIGFVWKTILVIASASVFFIPWLWLLFSSGSAANSQPLIPPPTSFNVIQALVSFVFGFQTQGIQSILISLWPLTVVTLFFVFTRRMRVIVHGITYFILASFLPIILVFFVSFFKPIFLSRYLIVVTPTLFFLIAWILTQYSKRISTILITGVFIIMLSLMIYQTTSAITPVREDYAGVSKYLQSRATPHDIIAVSAPFTVYPIEYTYTGQTKITTIPLWDRYESGGIPGFSVSELDKRMKKYNSQYARMFLILSYDQGYERAIRKYFDSYQLLDRKIVSPKLEIRVYKLRYY